MPYIGNGVVQIVFIHSIERRFVLSRGSNLDLDPDLDTLNFLSIRPIYNDYNKSKEGDFGFVYNARFVRKIYLQHVIMCSITKVCFVTKSCELDKKKT